jgi:nicotianamine synthase
MSDPVDRILELCTLIDACAADMDVLRAAHPVGLSKNMGNDDDAPLWGGTVGVEPSKFNGTSYWFDDIEPVYGELDEIIRYASAGLHERVLGDERIRVLAPVIHRVRAAYERDKEIIQARNLARADDGAERLKRTIEEERYWALGDELRAALGDSRHVLVAGSGPLPLTALCIGAELDVRVTCVERDTECHALGKQLIAMSGRDDHFQSINTDILEMTTFDEYDAIVGVVLLGVATEADEASSKATIGRHIVAHMPPGGRLVLRDPHGLGRLLYPSVDLGNRGDVHVSHFVPPVGPTQPYRSGLVVAERLAPDAGHAH